MRRRFPNWTYTLIPFLLITVFYLSNVNRLGDLLFTKPVALLFLIHVLAFYGLLALLRFVFRMHTHNAILVTSFTAFFFFAFGAIQDALAKDQGKLIYTFSNVAVLLGIFFIVLVALVIWMRKKPKLSARVNHFLLLLYVVLIVYELAHGIIIHLKGKQHLPQQPLTTIQPVELNRDSLPDIYHFLFDTYTSKAEVKRNWGYDNPIYDTLKALGFYTVDSAFSNYPFTTLSLNSFFNMNYLSGGDEDLGNRYDQFLQWSLRIHDNSWFRILQQNDYRIYMQSIVDTPYSNKDNGNIMHGSPQTWLRLQTLERQIHDPWRLHKIQQLLGSEDQVPRAVKEYYGLIQQYTTDCISRANQAISRNEEQPSYHYFHFFLPHYPYLYDSAGKRRPVSLETLSIDKEGYLPQLKFANTLITDFANKIVNRSSKRPVIVIFSGDHGFRDAEDRGKAASHYQTMCAIYYSDRKYQALTTSMSLVNLYRQITNKTFHQQLPLLKDQVFLEHK